MFTTPWHCSVAFRTDCSIISKPKIEFEFDPRFELVYENGLPSYFQEKEGDAMAEEELGEDSE